MRYRFNQANALWLLDRLWLLTLQSETIVVVEILYILGAGSDLSSSSHRCVGQNTTLATISRGLNNRQRVGDGYCFFTIDLHGFSTKKEYKCK